MLDLYNRSQKLLIVKENFAKQAFFTTLFVSILMVLVSFRYGSFSLTLSLVIGIIISFCASLTLWQWVKYVFRDLNPHAHSPDTEGAAYTSLSISTTKSLVFALMGVGKMLALALAFFFIFKYLSINTVALFVGVSVVQLVVFSMVISMVLVNMLNRSSGLETGREGFSVHDSNKDAVRSDSDAVSTVRFVR